VGGEEEVAGIDVGGGGGAGAGTGAGGAGTTGTTGGGPALYAIDPSGSAHRYYGTAVGKGRQAAKTAIERLDLTALTCAQGVVEAAKILHAVHEGDKPFELELAWVCDASGRRFERVPAEVAAAAEAAAKAALADSDMDE
jgi:20S proteasome subunit alpha 7